MGIAGNRYNFVAESNSSTRNAFGESDKILDELYKK